MANLATERSMSLNLDSWLGGFGVGNMEELDSNLQLVNDAFFDSYVQELEGQATAPLSQGPATQQPFVSPTGLPMQIVPGAVASFSGPHMHQAVPMLGMQTALEGLQPPLPAMQSGSLPGLQQVAMPALQPVPNPGMQGMPHVGSSTSGLGQSTSPTSLQQHNVQSTLGTALVVAPAVTTGLTEKDPTGGTLRQSSSDQQHEHGSNSGGGFDSGADNYIEVEEVDYNGKKKKRRIRTPKQQVLNKLAQQRYRERRKAKYSEMETSMEALADQLARLQHVEQDNKSLSKKNEELAKQLAEQQAQLAFLREQLNFSTQAAAAAAAARANADAADANGERVAGQDLEAVRQKMDEVIDSIRRVLQQHGLGEQLDSAALERLPAQAVAQLASFVGETCTLCMQLLASNKPHVVEAMRSDTARFKDVRCPVLRATWTQVLRNLSLSKMQEEMLLDLRQKHLESLRVLYNERHRLNMQAMALMLPRQPDPTPDGKLRCMKEYGQICGLRQDGALRAVLEEIKANLNREQRGFMEVNHYTAHKLLTPVQAAKLIVDAYPHSMDALALANCLAAQQEEAANGHVNQATQQQQAPTAAAEEGCASHCNSNSSATIKAEVPLAAQSITSC